MRSISGMLSDEMAGDAKRRVPILKKEFAMRKTCSIRLLFVGIILTAALCFCIGDRKSVV